VKTHSKTRRMFSATIFAIALLLGGIAHAQTYTVLHNFTGGGDGGAPYAGLTIDRGGNLYGTTSGGFNCAPPSCGTVFKMTHRNGGWVLSPLYAFTGSNGATPLSRVVFGPDGALYGTTYAGGENAGGTVYKLTPPANVCPTVSCPWSLTALHQFTLLGESDGIYPGYGDLIFNASGDIYGTTIEGYGGLCNDQTCGGVYELSHTQGRWTETPVFSMANFVIGYWPYAGVSLDSAGNLYGATGINYSGLFKLSYDGAWFVTGLMDFENSASGIYGTPVFDSAGNLFDDIAQGNPGGSVYELMPNGNGWIFNTVYAFSGSGLGPVSTLTVDSSGNLYGVTNQLGAHGYGNVFKLSRSGGGWSYTSLYDFTGGTDGANPWGQVILDPSGNIYGTTVSGGSSGNGVVFEITP
jgi:uncharacterized repeat protein (TIGR03803 family)